MIKLFCKIYWTNSIDAMISIWITKHTIPYLTYGKLSKGEKINGKNNSEFSISVVDCHIVDPICADVIQATGWAFTPETVIHSLWVALLGGNFNLIWLKKKKIFLFKLYDSSGLLVL